MRLTTRLSLFFLTALALVLLGFSGTLYYLASTHLHHQLDERLQAALDVLTSAVEIETKGVEWEPQTRGMTVNASVMSIEWSVSNPSGRRVDGSPEAPQSGDGWLLLERQIPEVPFAKHGGAEQWADDDGKTLYISLKITAAVSEGPLRHTLRTLGWTLAGLSLTLWTAAALTGRWLSRRALSPLRRMAETARTINADELDRRLPNANTGDELEELGGAFNELLARLQESFERQRRFTGDASHQLRTPLAAMLGQVEVALRRERPLAEYQRVLALVHKQSAKLREIVEMLLFLSRADAEAKQPRLETVDLTEWLPAHLQTWAAHARSADLHLEVADGSSLVVKAQTPLLGQLVDNLLDNACKYSEPGKPVTVRVHAKGNGVLLTVEDEGYGIEAAELPHVFEPFYRSPKARALGRGGFGLGLAVARRIAEAFAGDLSATTAVGRGTCFTLRLPPARLVEQRTLAGHS